jgi:hypothetical protein
VKQSLFPEERIASIVSTFDEPMSTMPTFLAHCIILDSAILQTPIEAHNRCVLSRSIASTLLLRDFSQTQIF